MVINKEHVCAADESFIRAQGGIMWMSSCAARVDKTRAKISILEKRPPGPSIIRVSKVKQVLLL